MTIDRVQRTRALLPMLRIEVAAPCDVPWESMTGDETRRHCAQCNKTIHDLTAMTSDEVSAFLASAGSTPCARVYQRRDGTVMNENCPFGVRRRRLRAVLVSGLSITAIAFGAFTALSLIGTNVSHRPSHLHASTTGADDTITSELPGFLTVVAPENAVVIVDGEELEGNVAHIALQPGVPHAVSVMHRRSGKHTTQDVTLAAGEMRTISMSPPRVPRIVGLMAFPRRGPYID